MLLRKCRFQERWPMGGRATHTKSRWGRLRVMKKAVMVEANGGNVGGCGMPEVRPLVKRRGLVAHVLATK